MIKLDFSRSKLRTQSIVEYNDKIIKYDKELEKEAKNNGEMVGWMFLPENYDKEEVKRILKAKEKIQKDSDVLVVIGIGGSYLGAKAVIDALIRERYKKDTEVIFVGNNMSTRYINEVLSYIEDKDFSINVISKSGTTTEPAIAFRIFRQFLVEKYGVEESRKRIYVTTDSTKGALKEIATEEAYETFIIPNNVGGRYSVLTPVGLLPIAVAGIVFLVRLYITYKRKKLYFDGKVLVIKPPKRAIGRHTVIMQKGKVSKKLYTYQKPTMKVGGNYVVVYEEKSFNILEVQEMKVQMAGMKAIKKNPKFKM